jgi:predicted ATP-binding protein involved in virulence
MLRLLGGKELPETVELSVGCCTAQSSNELRRQVTQYPLLAYSGCERVHFDNNILDHM